MPDCYHLAARSRMAGPALPGMGGGRRKLPSGGESEQPANCPTSIVTLDLAGMHKLGVVLFQLGGPDSLEAIEPFLYNLFSDPDIIDFPFARIARQPLARLISTTRARHVRQHYAEIGGTLADPGEHPAPGARAGGRTAARFRRARSGGYALLASLHVGSRAPVGDARPAGPMVLLPLYPQYSRLPPAAA